MDKDVAAELGIDRGSVVYKRRLLGIPPYQKPRSRRPRGYRWTARTLLLLGKASDRDIAKRLGVSTSTVFQKRRVLGIASYGPSPRRLRWTEEMIAMVGALSDRALARRLGTAKDTVAWKRVELGRAAPPYRPPKRIARTAALKRILELPNRQLQERYGMARSTLSVLRAEFGMPTPDGRNLRWTREAIARLGKEPDSAIARSLGMTGSSVAKKRWSLGIAPCRALHRWTDAERALFWKMSNRQVAKRLGLSLTTVQGQRRRLGIPSPSRQRKRR